MIPKTPAPRKPSHQEIILKDFKFSWDKEHAPEEYFIQWGRDMKAATELIEMDIPPDTYQERKMAYLRSPKWWEMCRHSFGAFVHNFNQFVPDKRRRETSQPIIRRELRVFCSECDTEHNAYELCPKCYPVVEGDKETAIKAIEKLTNQWGMK